MLVNRRRSYLAMGCAVLSSLIMSGCGNFFQSNGTISSIGVTPPAAVIKVGDKLTCTATAHTVGGNDNDVTSSAQWSSSSPIAEVDASGTVTGLKTGQTNINATKDKATSSAILLISQYDLVSIDLTPTNTSVYPNSGAVQFKAIGVFSDGSTRDLTQYVRWRSSDSGVATITSSGVASPISSGETTITASIVTAKDYVSANTHLTVY